MGAVGTVKYRTIVADPPWEVKRGPLLGAGAGFSKPDGWKSRDLPYPTMTLDEIAALPVESMAEDDAHLYLWTINKYVEQSYSIARAWGFEPSTLITWCKEPMGCGLGGAYGITTEFALFCRRGSLAAIGHENSTWRKWKRPYEHGRHSAKPDPFTDMVERVSPGPYLELFARRQRLGWDTWGNEALCHVELEAAP
jgi:N6-adenosine-specific RNA methylase IME4